VAPAVALGTDARAVGEFFRLPPAPATPPGTAAAGPPGLRAPRALPSSPRWGAHQAARPAAAGRILATAVLPAAWLLFTLGKLRGGQTQSYFVYLQYVHLGIPRIDRPHHVSPCKTSSTRSAYYYGTRS
jgi:hypothetical protein